MVQVEMFSKILWYLEEKEGTLVLEDNEDT